MNDVAILIDWLREAADELEKAHALLDAEGIPRDHDDRGVQVGYTLSARIALLADKWDAA